MGNLIALVLKYKHFIAVVIFVSGMTGMLSYALAKGSQQPVKIIADVPASSADSQLAEQIVIDAVATQTRLPTNEKPILATVSQKEKLQNQKFFKQAENGDKILMYPNNKKVVLYRPETDKVIAEAPLEYRASTKPGAGVAGASTSNESPTP